MDRAALVHSGQSVEVSSARTAVDVSGHRDGGVAVSASPGSDLVVVVMRPEGAFDGPYALTPTVDGFELETRNRTMRHDMTVNPIPFMQAANESGGYTATIG